MILNRNLASPFHVGTLTSSGGARANVGLNAAYVHDTSGPAVGIRLSAPAAAAINEVYIFLDDVGGTLANVTMECKIYNENSQTRPGSTVRATSSTTTMPGAVDKWIKFAFSSPYTPVVGEILWFVFYNTAGAPATDFPNILTGTNMNLDSLANVGVEAGYSTTNGFAAATSQQEMPFVAKFGSDYIGQPFTQNSTSYYTSNQRRRGMGLTFPAPMNIGGFETTVATSAHVALEIYDSSTAPGGTPLYSYALDATANLITADLCGGRYWTPITLPAVDYKVVLTFSTNSAAGSVHQIEDYSSYSAVFDALREHDKIKRPWGVIDDGAGGWTIDKAISPNMRLLVDSFPAASGGVTTPVLVDGQHGVLAA